MGTHKLKCLCVTFLAISAQAFSNVTVANQYRIAVTPDLEAYGKFQIPDAKLRIRKDGRVRLRYDLPKELVGDLDGDINAEGRIESLDKPFVLMGDNVNKVECEVIGRSASCHMLYNNNLPVLEPGAEQQVVDYLKKTVSDPTEQQARIKVLGQFLRGPGLDAVASHEAGGWFDNLYVRFD